MPLSCAWWIEISGKLFKKAEENSEQRLWNIYEPSSAPISLLWKLSLSNPCEPIASFPCFTLQGKPPENDAQDFPASLAKVLEKEEEIEIKTFSRGKLGKLYRQWYRKPHCSLGLKIADLIARSIRYNSWWLFPDKLLFHFFMKTKFSGCPIFVRQAEERKSIK